MARTSLQTDRRVLTLPTLRLERRRAREEEPAHSSTSSWRGEPSRAEPSRLVLGCVSRSASEAGCGGGRPGNQPSLLTVPKQQRTAEESHLRHPRRPFVRWKRPSRLDPNGCGGTNEPNFRGLLPPGGVASLAVARPRADLGAGRPLRVLSAVDGARWGGVGGAPGVVASGRNSGSSQANSLALVQVLSEPSPQSLQARNAAGLTPLHLAVARGPDASPGVVACLLDQRPGVLQQRDARGLLPMELAVASRAPLDVLFLCVLKWPECVLQRWRPRVRSVPASRQRRPITSSLRGRSATKSDAGAATYLLVPCKCAATTPLGCISN
jgi:hypothetical protein